MRGGCLPVKQLKGMDKFLMSLLVKMLKTERIKMKNSSKPFQMLKMVLMA
jgi:hypothetical protein